MLVDQDHGTGGNLLGLGLGLGHRVASLLCQVVEVLLVLVGAGGLQQAAAREILKAGVDQLQTDFVIAGAAGLMGVEGSGRGVIQVDGGDNANFHAQLVVDLLGDGLVNPGGCFVHIDGAGVSLVAGGNRGSGGSGVGGEAVGIVGHNGTDRLKAHEVQRLRAVQHRALVVVQAGNGLHIVAVGHGPKIVRRGLELREAHAVTDEQEHILGSLDGLVRGGLARQCVDRSRVCLNRAGATVFDGSGAAGKQSGRQSERQGDC